MIPRDENSNAVEHINYIGIYLRCPLANQNHHDEQFFIENNVFGYFDLAFLCDHPAGAWDIPTTHVL